MSEPEIDRRCNLCGAAVRARAAFCPQCGQPVLRQSRSADTQIDLGEAPIMNNEAPVIRNEASAINNNDTVPLIREPIPDLAKTQPLTAFPKPSARAPEQKPHAQTVAPVSDSSVKGRVDKIRKASSIVIDQAAYDPSLRFILVAAAFFLLFLFLLIMSKVLG